MEMEAVLGHQHRRDVDIAMY